MRSIAIAVLVAAGVADRGTSIRQRAHPPIMRGQVQLAIFIAAKKGIRNDLLLGLLLFLLTLQVGCQTDGLLVHQARPDARLGDRLRVRNRVMVGQRPIAVEVHTGLLRRVVEVHACGMRIGWIEYVMLIAGDSGRLRWLSRWHWCWHVLHGRWNRAHRLLLWHAL